MQAPRAGLLPHASAALESQFVLPPVTVRIDTVRIHYPDRLDQRPDLWLTLSWPAVRVLLDSTRSGAIDSLVLATWKFIPASLSLRSLVLNVRMSDGIDGHGQRFDADSLDRIQPRPQ